MTKNEIIKFYENKIDDIENDDTKNDLLGRLDELEEILNEIDTNIDMALEEQESEYIPYFPALTLYDEFNQLERMC